MRLPRLSVWLLATIVLLAVIGLLYPQQLPVSFYKLSLVCMAGVAGYWLDCALFPYARPDGYLALAHAERYRKRPEAMTKADYPVVKGYAMVFAAAMIRRAIVVCGAMLAIGLGA